MKRFLIFAAFVTAYSFVMLSQASAQVVNQNRGVTQTQVESRELQGNRFQETWSKKTDVNVDQYNAAQNANRVTREQRKADPHHGQQEIIAHEQRQQQKQAQQKPAANYDF